MALHHYTFNNKAEELYPLVSTVEQLLQSVAHASSAAGFRAKAALTELLTNAIKHAGDAETTIEVIVDDQAILIKKLDSGEPLVLTSDGLKYVWPLPGVHHQEKTITIYGDDELVLKARFINNTEVTFYTEELLNLHPDAGHLPEHFGLMIIARACSHFSYRFDIDTCTNIFTVIIPTE
ncbi:hypothetical protein DYU05_05165 [Mucilaginibacter terrenus]|uniref:Histidine kinase/HSP90-like ATPase domain-containing protein n=1 Tax=Mucilaginibacter terrenus TaxID=2482727 RepID=A0A3E2NVF0_9SPHI|nr:hypothetical protein [Mucilaginibacter terrenus]RFZ84996.1 hypothetical protein DYU05_05165 [Mucilaginibacter terrenus]